MSEINVKDLNLRADDYILTRIEETAVYKELKVEKLRECDTYTKAFADCMQSQFVLAAVTCRKQLRDMQGCLKEKMTTKAIDDARIKYIIRRREEREQRKNGTLV